MSIQYYPKYYSAYQKSNMLQHVKIENMLIGGNAPRKDYMKSPQGWVWGENGNTCSI